MGRHRQACLLPCLQLAAFFLLCSSEGAQGARSLLKHGAFQSTVLKAFPSGGGLGDGYGVITPEAVRLDKDDFIYFTSALNGKLYKLSQDGQQILQEYQFPFGGPSDCPPGATPGYLASAFLGLTIDDSSNLYVTVNTPFCNPENSGVYKVDRNDLSNNVKVGALAPELVAPGGCPMLIMNNIEFYEGSIYVTDTFCARILKLDLPQAGGAVREIKEWVSSPLLAAAPAGPSVEGAPPPGPAPGPNGIRVYQGKVYVSVSVPPTTPGVIVTIPLNADGSAGTPEVFVTLREDFPKPPGYPFPHLGGDDFCMDVQGTMYLTTDPGHTLLKVTQDKQQEIILGPQEWAADGPTSCAFGNRGANKKNMYVSSGAFPFFIPKSGDPATRAPSIIKVQSPLPGLKVYA